MTLFRRIPKACAVGTLALISTWHMALAESLTEATGAQPLTATEMTDFVISVQRCWNVGSLSTEALRVTVSVGVSLNEDGKPDRESFGILAYEGGSKAAAQEAFEVARRAILRCGRDGYDLPADKYETWKDLNVVFDPNGMHMR